MAVTSKIKSLEIGKSYSFEDLEKYLFQYKNRKKFLKLFDLRDKQKAIMHVFFANFYGDWKSGDGVLFYDDCEVHSADSDDMFKVVEVMSM